MLIRLEIPPYFIIRLWETLSYRVFVFCLCASFRQQYQVSLILTGGFILILFPSMQLPVGATDAELEERIIQHLAAAAAMGRARHIGRRESQRNRSSAQVRPQFFVFSTHPNTSTADPVSSSPTQREGEPTPTVTVPTPSSPAAAGEESPEQSTQLLSASASGSSALASSQHESTLNNRYLPTFDCI